VFSIWGGSCVVGGHCALWGPSSSVRRHFCVVGGYCALRGPSTWVWLGHQPPSLEARSDV